MEWLVVVVVGMVVGMVVVLVVGLDTAGRRKRWSRYLPCFLRFRSLTVHRPALQWPPPPPPPPPPTHHLEVTMLGVLGVTRVLVVECRLHVTVHDNR